MGKNTQRQKTVHRGSKYLREFSSGGVVYRRFGNGVKWLVTATVPNDLFPKLSWRLPKGWLDDSDTWGVPGLLGRGEKKATEEELQRAALREVREEGGIDAIIVQKIESVRTFFKHPERGLILKFITYYLMEWVKDLPEGFGEETSEIEWLPYEEARKRLSYNGEKKILDKAREVLDSGVQNRMPL